MQCLVMVDIEYICQMKEYIYVCIYFENCREEYFYYCEKLEDSYLSFSIHT